MQGIEYGSLTKREKDLLSHLGNTMADWFEAHKTVREEILAVFTVLCHLIFAKQTPITDKEEQCKEVDSFCECLKLRIRET